MTYIVEPQKKVPVIGEYDLCVLGGGCTGVFAAVRAARLGLTVAIIEKTGCFGGASTLSQINVWHSIYDFDFKNQIIGGLTVEVLDRLRLRDNLFVRNNKINMFQFNSEEMKIELDNLITESGVYPFLHTLYVGPLLQNANHLAGVFVENKDGRGVILGKVFIDSTGDGDLCRDLNIERSVNLETLMPPTPCFRLYKENEYPIYITNLIKEHGEEFGLEDDWGWNISIPGIPQERQLVETHILGYPCISAANITKCEILGRQQIRAVVDLLRKHLPDNDPIRISSIAQNIGIRESYRYKTMYSLKDEDVLGTGTPFNDAVLNSSYPMDIHHPNSTGITMRYLNGYERTCNRKKSQVGIWKTYSGDYPRLWHAPYRCIVLEQFDNILLAGRSINCDHGAFSALRVRINLNQLGEAAGVAAFVAIHDHVSLKSVDIDKLKKKLQEGGSILY